MQSPKPKGRPMLELMGMGFELLTSIALLAGAGYGVDYLTSSGPWGLLVGLFLGCVVGMILMIRTALSASRRRSDV